MRNTYIYESGQFVLADQLQTLANNMAGRLSRVVCEIGAK